MYIKVNPQKAINYSLKQTLKKISLLLSDSKLRRAFDIENFYPSPVELNTNSDWLKKSKIIGINPRIIGSYFNIVKYAMTFPEDAIHIMPIWENGVDGGIYARTNWKLSSEWLDKELVEYGFETPEKQLKLVVNLLHALGKKVGFDCIPHTDKFSEEVFVAPECFEWIRLNADKTAEVKYKDSEDVYPELQKCILEYLSEYCCADGTEFNQKEEFFSLSLEKRSLILFGSSLEKRTSRRIALMNYVREKGFETIPVTEHIPSRPIQFDCIKTNEFGDYADFKIKNKASNAKIFNAITPYRWYKIDENGFPLIDSPIENTFNYFFEQVEKFQKEFNFDFLRADMAHNQISHSHFNSEKNSEFDCEMWKILKKRIQKKTPYFATFAEAFLSNYYIDGIVDMINKNFDIVLGNSNFRYLNAEFIELVKYYQDISINFDFSPCIVSITNDSDQKHNNSFHQSPLSNEIRYFVQMFLTLPGYTGMGFECRNLLPQKDSEYSGVYTNYQEEKYTWGENTNLFHIVSRIRKLYKNINLSNLKTYIIPDTSENTLLWLLCDTKTNEPRYFCVVNLDTSSIKKNIEYSSNIVYSLENKVLKPLFSLRKSNLFIKSQKADLGYIKNVEFGDARIYEIKNLEHRRKTIKNKKQILIVTTEYTPYAKTGGLADYCTDLACNYNNINNSDMRIIMPLYNADNASFEENNSYIELFDKFDNEEPVRYEIENTKIEIVFSYGIYNSYAKLYMIKNPVNSVPVYLVYSPVFSHQKKEYNGNLQEFSAAYTAAVVALLKKMDKKLKFKPSVVQANDHLTANSILLIKSLSKYDNFYRNIKTVYTVHNVWEEIKIPITNAVLLYFDKYNLQKLCKNKQFKTYIENIKTIQNKEIEQQFENLLKKYYKCILQNGLYNVVKQVLYVCDNWITVSEYMYTQLTRNKYKILDFIHYIENKEKGYGILSGINNRKYNPLENPVFPYGLNNYRTGKKKNKLFFQKEFSKENVLGNNISKLLIQPNSQVLGYLNIDEDAILMLSLIRLDKTKGFRIVKNALSKIIQYPKTQVVIVCDGIIKENNDIWQDKEMQKLLNSGRLLVIDSFVDVELYFSSADLYLMSSYFETCGFALMQAMRYGTVPVANNTGCVSEIIISLSESENLVNGFKIKEQFNSPVIIEEKYNKLLFEAIEIFSTLPNIRDKMVQNALCCDCSWNKKTISKYWEIFEG